MEDYNSKVDYEGLVEVISETDMPGLIRFVPTIYSMAGDPVELAQVKSLFLNRAAELGNEKLIRQIMTTVEKDSARKKRNEDIRINQELQPAFLDLDDKGAPAETITNFLNVMLMDPHYRNVKFNLVTNQAETIKKDVLVPWTDTEEAESMDFIEREYKLYSPQKHTCALKQFFDQRAYNPIIDLIETIQWDGKSRIEDFLHTWLKADDSEYTREVSRLIFAGGINRLYNPGCKFDDVPVLVGTHQGEGKSTIIKWLAMNEQWFAEIKKVDGPDSVEALFGAWVCEIPELSAFKRADDVESIKAFVTRQKDKYRKPYDKNPVEYPRRCIFIGTTNNSQFLVDKTGNRRFYPVTARSSGYYLFDHEKECREYIMQCWAEARERYKAGKMPAFANYKLLSEFQKHQNEAMEDDWREGKIEDYLAKEFAIGEMVCAIQIYSNCLYPDTELRPKRSDSFAIGQIMAKMEGWEPVGIRKTAEYGKQRCWKKTANSAAYEASLLPEISSADDLPF